MSPFAVGLDLWQEGADAVDDAELVHRNHPIPVVLGQLVEQTTCGHTGVVAENMDLAKHVDRSVGRLEDRLLLGNVTDDAGDLATAFFQLGLRPPEGLGIDVRQHDLHAGLGECASHSQTHPAGAPGDESGFPCYVLHASSPAVPHTDCSLSPRRMDNFNTEV